MKTIMARSNSQDFSSKRHFHWTRKVSNEDDETPTFKSSSNTSEDDKKENEKGVVQEPSVAAPAPAPAPAQAPAQTPTPKKKLQAVAVSRLRSVLTIFGRNRSQLPHGLGPEWSVLFSGTDVGTYILPSKRIPLPNQPS
ncbi:hypothetical protein CK203_011355 [Vitis vinifera]|uniref:Uncharacterized protein n=1 Tax=Vitis vinifera TaxID=29760 RepID=A0A438JYH0_VITVI|nr:hypothetical protein CK203_011355 [Vitis vinifera]